MIRNIVIALLAAGVALACASTTEPETAPEPKPIVKAEPVRPEPEQVEQVKVAETAVQLPKTASPLPLIGLTGLAALALGAGTRALRRLL